MPKTLAFLITEDWYFCSHRLNLARAALRQGYRVVVLTRVDQHRPRIEAEGIEVIALKQLRRASRHPLRELAAIAEITRHYMVLRPAIAHHVALKPILYGTLAARLAQVPGIVNAFAGLGFVFTQNNAQTFVLRNVVRTVLRLLLDTGRVR